METEGPVLALDMIRRKMKENVSAIMADNVTEIQNIHFFNTIFHHFTIVRSVQFEMNYKIYINEMVIKKNYLFLL